MCIECRRSCLQLIGLIWDLQKTLQYPTGTGSIYNKGRSQKNWLPGMCHFNLPGWCSQWIISHACRFSALQHKGTLIRGGLAEQGINIEHLDLGGGLGVTYRDETPASAGDYITAIKNRLAERADGGKQFKLIFEPGRSVAANAGVFLTQVEYLKLNDHKNFAIIDGAMNDLIRPSLYSAWQDIKPLTETSEAPIRRYDLVGPVCETGDFLGKDRELPLAAGDLVAVMSAGAYGFVMASNYNSRGRPAEVMVDGDQLHLVRKRETIEELFAGEQLIAE